jgi:hypothetical protein
MDFEKLVVDLEIGCTVGIGQGQQQESALTSRVTIPPLK